VKCFVLVSINFISAHMSLLRIYKYSFQVCCTTALCDRLRIMYYYFFFVLLRSFERGGVSDTRNTK
jgi:hypothetical protein